MYIPDNAELAENKLAILYISKNLDVPLTNKRLSQIVSEGNLFNFFLLQHILEDLAAGAFLSKATDLSGETTYEITKKGRETLSFLIHKLPKGIRKYIDRLTGEETSAARRDRDVTAYIEPGNGDTFISVLEIKEGSVLLFSTRYASATKNDALKMCDKLKKDAEKIYSAITQFVLK